MPSSARVTAASADERPLGEERDRGDEPHQDDAERHRRPDVVGAGPAEEAEDRHRDGGPVGPHDEHRGAELPERDGERKPGGDGQRACEQRKLDLAAHLGRRRSQHGGRLAEADVDRAEGRNECADDERQRDERLGEGDDRG